LRFGSAGVSTSMIAIACLSIWGAIHGRGPFAGSGPLDNVLSLQLFLLFATAPFMVLAALVEERMRVEEDLREGEERLRFDGGREIRRVGMGPAERTNSLVQRYAYTVWNDRHR
jgi:hypothetical protein